MLARYTMIRGAPASALPQGVRQDTRKHTKHVLRPTPELVASVLGTEDAAGWERFRKAYAALLAERFSSERERFDDLASRAQAEDVFLGCSCPSSANPDVMRCHTTLALGFMKKKYPKLDVRLPGDS
jgi:uncharacterized protein YeaO (DUF488 family)